MAGRARRCRPADALRRSAGSRRARGAFDAARRCYPTPRRCRRAAPRDALRKDHHTLREEAPDRNDAVWFFFLRDLFLGLLALLPA